MIESGYCAVELMGRNWEKQEQTATTLRKEGGWIVRYVGDMWDGDEDFSFLMFEAKNDNEAIAFARSEAERYRSRKV